MTHGALDHPTRYGLNHSSHVMHMCHEHSKFFMALIWSRNCKRELCFPPSSPLSTKFAFVCRLITIRNLQERTRQCRDPTFIQFTARPYILGLQDMLFQCSEPTHDFYHVEPQHTCLLDNEGHRVIDYIIRYVHLMMEKHVEHVII
jgi:hypothetical protein